MAQYNAYPKELPHPNGFKTLTVYDADEERQVQRDFESYRAENARAQQAALRGETLSAPVVNKGGRPRKNASIADGGDDIEGSEV